MSSKIYDTSKQLRYIRANELSKRFELFCFWMLSVSVCGTNTLTGAEGDVEAPGCGFVSYIFFEFDKNKASLSGLIPLFPFYDF